MAAAETQGAEESKKDLERWAVRGGAPAHPRAAAEAGGARWGAGAVCPGWRPSGGSRPIRRGMGAGASAASEGGRRGDEFPEVKRRKEAAARERGRGGWRVTRHRAAQVGSAGRQQGFQRRRLCGLAACSRGSACGRGAGRRRAGSPGAKARAE